MVRLHQLTNPVEIYDEGEICVGGAALRDVLPSGGCDMSSTSPAAEPSGAIICTVAALNIEPR
jgi:hypothetical protein